MRDKWVIITKGKVLSKKKGRTMSSAHRADIIRHYHFILGNVRKAKLKTQICHVRNIKVTLSVEMSFLKISL